MNNPKFLSGTLQRLTIWLVAITIIVFVVWASRAPLDEIVRGPGELVPSSKAQTIQNLEGGILAELLVREGDVVERNAVVARLDSTQFTGTFRELQEQLLSLEIRLYRLKRELDKETELNLPSNLLEAAPEVAESESRLFDARLQDYKSAFDAASETLQLREQEVELLLPMQEKKVVPPIDVIRAQQAASEARGRLEALKSEYELSRAEAYSETLTEFSQLQQTRAIRQDQLRRTTLVSPVKGIVNKILITTIGGVVGPGEEIIEIIPLEDELRVEGRIKPKDIAFLYPKMRATIKLSAYDYTIFGSLSGKVEHISADTFEDETRRDADPYYKVIVKVDQSSLNGSKGEIEIRPGMIADVELHTGQKTILQYLLKPLFKTTEAFREP